MALIVDLLLSLLLVGGGVFALAAAIGVNRLPDVYCRMHAASKAGTVGSGLMLVAAGIDSGSFADLARCMAGFVFLILTAPVAAHLLARAARAAGIPLAPSSIYDDNASQAKSAILNTDEA